MTLHIPAPVLHRLAALASLDAQSEPHTEEVYAGLVSASAAFLAAANTPGAEITLIPVGILWDERLLAEAKDPAYSNDPDGGLARSSW